MRSRLLACILATGLFASGCSTSSTSGTAPTGAPASTGGAVQFLSTQYNTVDETSKVRDTILKDAPVQSQFQPSALGPFNDRAAAEQKAGKVTVGVIGGQHGDFAPFVKSGYLADLTPLVQRLADRNLRPK